MKPFIYLIPSLLNQAKLQSYLPTAPEYSVSMQKGEKCPGVLLDTFEAELFHSARMLLQLGERLLLSDLKTGQLLEQVITAKWLLADDLPEGPVQAVLQKVVALRAFLPVAKIEICEASGALLDDEGKTRARFNNLTINRGQKSIGLGATSYLRGYDKAYADLRLSLEKMGAFSCKDVGQVYDALKIKRALYEAKPTILLDPEAPVKETTGVIINTFLRTARQNEKGLIADYDTEFLHQYRVSLRKVRSVLSLFKEVYSQEDTVKLKQDFASLMQKTNTLRDLDVYLLDKKRYFSLVPVDSYEGLDILFKFFENERKREHKIVSKFVKSKTYLGEIKRLQDLFMDGSAPASGPKAETNSLAFACRLIQKRYNKVCKIARTIDADTEDSIVHMLRINCKKLRYLMEFFSPLFPAAEIKSLIKSLKVLQDNLGLFNDYSVQQAFLKQLLHERMHDFAKAQIQVAESIGALSAMLHRLQQKERRQVMKNFALFDSLETRTTITKLFNNEDAVDENNSLLQ